MKLEIYPERAKIFDMEMVRLDESEISSRNKELILKFHNYMFSKECSKLRVVKLSSQLRRISLALGKNIESGKAEKLIRKELERE